MKAERNWDKGEWTLLKPLLEEEDFYEPIIVTEKKLDQCLYQLYKKTLQSFGQSVPQEEKKNKNQSEPMVQQNAKGTSRKS